MPSAEQINAREQQIRSAWHAAHVRRFEESEASAVSWRENNIAPHAAEGLQLLSQLRRNGDLAAFQSTTDRWARSFPSGYAGPNGQMILNQINKMAPNSHEAVEVLIDCLSTPEDAPDALRKIRSLAAYLEKIRVGAHPSAKRAPFVASYWWGLENAAAWPVAWPKSSDYVAYSTGSGDHEDQGLRYQELHRFATEVDGDPLRFERVASWWADERPVFAGSPLCDRAALRVAADKDNDHPDDYLANARALVAFAGHLGSTLEKDVSEAVGRTLKAYKPGPKWDGVWPRGDFWVDWRVPGTYGLAVRAWLNAHGLAIGLRPYAEGAAGANERVVPVIEAQPIPGYELLTGPGSRLGRDAGFVGGTGELIYARWFDRDALDGLDLPAEVRRTAHEVAPLMAELNGDPTVVDADDELTALVAEFKEVTGYPTPAHEQDEADRREFAEMLVADQLPTVDKAELRRIWNTGRYGGTGPMSSLNVSLRDADDAEYQRIADTFAYLCWGEEPPTERINRVLDDESLRIKGFGESVIMKMLAITHRDRFITVYPYAGAMGKLKMLNLLGITPPTSTTRGELQVESNDLLRSRLDPYFPGDALGIGAFLYWLVRRAAAPEVEGPSTVDPLDLLSEELLVDRGFIDDVVAMLQEKKQVVFYGPPGTGKTYFARKLAEALVPDVERRPIVQFHPSTSYEDFFEGYRPEVLDGVMTYRLQRGPLAELAARASDAPGRRHVMIIDEINRANLPKVLGELLFLLEYRDTPVRTLYRPDDPFELSKDIWFIGTMNTADRSIALVDAALRRRFHFVPFFPNHGPMAGLLERWLADKKEPTWVGDLVAQVNDELERELGGPHLQLGPSHFMKTGLDRDRLRRIWEYDIEPFIEDQFFGDPAKIDSFRFAQVWERYATVAPEVVAEVDDGPEASA